jgi:hypothetical protein
MIKITTAILTFALSLAIFSTTAQADQTVQGQKEWTFLVFINGHNNLDSYGAENIKGMEKVGSNEQLNIVVQWASESNQDTRRLLIKKDTSGSSEVTSPVVQSITPRVDMGDYNSLIDFVKWGVQNYPAKHYFIAVWNHGNGWHLQSTGGNMHAQDISWDDLSGNHMTTEQLGIAINQAAKIIGHKVDIYGSDACLMAMAEVAGEMKDAVNVFVGSQETEPGAGWPYETFLADWAAKPTMSAQEVGATLSKDYEAAYSGGIYGSEDVTFAAYDMSHYEGLVSAVKTLAAELTASSNLQAVASAASSAQGFYDADYKDLYDFVSGVQRSQVDVKASTLSDVKNAVQSFVITSNNTDGYKNAHGLSIWLPTTSYDYSQYSDRYQGMVFAQETGWGNFLAKLPMQ